MEKTGATKIATGHTASDNAETFLMRLITGAGPEGLSGIPPVRLPYIRPLIETTRAEVEAFLTEREIAWIVDSSNLKNDYLRNRIRNEIMPALAAVNPSAHRSLDRGRCRLPGGVCPRRPPRRISLRDTPPKRAYPPARSARLTPASPPRS